MAKIGSLGISGDLKEAFIDGPTIEAGGKLGIFKRIKDDEIILLGTTDISVNTSITALLQVLCFSLSD